MRTMTLKEVQAVSLNVLKKFHSFCQIHNLRYTLCYGSLLGAVRHKGFIPWDDDVDIMMPRDDYDKLLKLYKDDSEYRLYAFEKDNSYLAYARLAEIKRTCVISPSPWCKPCSGIWIDIFPIDGVEENYDGYVATHQMANSIWKQTFVERKYLRKLSSFKGTKSKLRIIYHKLKGDKPLKKLIKEQIFLCRRNEYRNSNRVSTLSQFWASLGKEFYPKSFFETYVELPFEDATFKCLKQYDAYLTQVYGDYMQIPPEDKRVSHSAHKYMWKE